MGKIKHNHCTGKKTPTYNTWNGMIGRCYHKSNMAYKYYGARGVAVCDEWRGVNGFAQFLADMGVRPDGKTLDRVNPEGNYEPSNCKWSSLEEQNLNKRKKCEPFL